MIWVLHSLKQYGKLASNLFSLLPSSKIGFEKSLLEILSIIRGSDLPGLTSTKASKDDSAGRMNNLTTKWSKQSAIAAKICTNCNDLVYVLASATLTKSLIQVAHPLLSAMKVQQKKSNDRNSNTLDAAFVLVDGDAETTIPVNMESDLLKSSEIVSQRKQQASNVVNFMDSDEGDNGSDQKAPSKAMNGLSSSSTLQKGELVQTPQQLSQYHMMVQN